jgi:flagellar protein FlaG
MMNISSVNTTAAYTSEASYNIGPSREMSTEEASVAKPSNNHDNDKVNEEYVQKNLDRILKAIQSPETTIDRSVHEVTKQVIYKVRNKVSGEVIRQFPEEKLVEAAAKLIELTGMMIDKKV